MSVILADLAGRHTRRAALGFLRNAAPNRVSSRRVLRTVEVRFAAGEGSAKQASQLLSRKLAPGLYRIRAASARNTVSGTCRVLGAAAELVNVVQATCRATKPVTALP